MDTRYHPLGHLLEADPSGRARCKVCRRLIPKGSLRFRAYVVPVGGLRMHLACARRQGFAHELRMLGLDDEALPVDPGPTALAEAVEHAGHGRWAEVRRLAVAAWVPTRDVRLADLVDRLDLANGAPAHLDTTGTIRTLRELLHHHRERRDPAWLRVYGSWFADAPLRSEALWVDLLGVLERNADARLNRWTTGPLDDVPFLDGWAAERHARWVAAQSIRSLTPEEESALVRLTALLDQASPRASATLDTTGLFAALDPDDPGSALVLADALVEAGEERRAAWIHAAVAGTKSLPDAKAWTALLGPFAALFSRTGTKLTHGVITTGRLSTRAPRVDEGIADDPGWHALHTLRVARPTQIAWAASAPRLQRLVLEEIGALHDLPVLPSVRVLVLPSIQRSSFAAAMAQLPARLPSLTRIEAQVRSTSSPLPTLLAVESERLGVELTIRR